MYTQTLKHIDDVRVGDTVLHNGEEKTVSKCNIKTGGFCGTTLFGDSYNCGYKKVIVLELRK